MPKTWSVVVLLSSLVIISSCSEKEQRQNASQQFIETGYMDSSVKPGDNFYMFINGKWYDTAKIATTESSAGAGSSYATEHVITSKHYWKKQ